MKYSDLQVGDIYYCTLTTEKVTQWEITHTHSIGVSVAHRNEKVCDISWDNWDSLIKARSMVSHDLLIEKFGEEELFQHTLADTILELIYRL